MSAKARKTDQKTSHDAAESVEDALPFLESATLYSLRRSRRRGRILDELVADTGIDKVTLSPRLRPLCNKGLVVEMGTRPGKSGRGQTVWVAREFA